MKLIKAILINLTLVLAACTSNNQVTFYLLKAMPSTSLKSAQNNVLMTGITILVKPAKFPEYLDRPQMVLRENDYKLQITEQHRWAEPIKNDFTRVLVENLNSRIAPSNARVYSKLDGSKPNHQLSIEVFQLDINMDDEAILKVEWSLLSTGKKAKLIKRQNSKYKVLVDDKSYESGVKAQSKAIALLADQIAKTIHTLTIKPEIEFGQK